MKNFTTYIFLLLVGVFIITACTDKKTDSTTATPVDNNFQGITLTDSGTVRPATNNNNSNPTAIQPNPGGVAMPIISGGAQHYTCPNNCKGSGGSSQGTCPVCGTAYQHNQAFHNQPGSAATSPVTSTTIQPGATQTNQAQNASGLYHYTCPKGCKGGAGAAGPCATCGATLAHNQAYHQ